MSLLQQGSLTHNSSDSNVLSPHGAGHGSYGGRVLTRGGGSNSNTPNHGSRTMVITPSDEATEPARFLPGGVLFLRGSDVSSEEGQQPRSSRGPQVRWTDDTVDNENMNKKKSKVCCIYRKERQFGESDSDETDSSSCSNSDSDDSPNEYERMPRYKPKKHSHSHSHCH
ncbi:Type 1 phosphatases regulator ypi1 [Coemansia sp. RSA 1646]|nr:Type 1 phosphatases regulator ypi1 [Coemansia sp. RSA 1646]